MVTFSHIVKLNMDNWILCVSGYSQSGPSDGIVVICFYNFVIFLFYSVDEVGFCRLSSACLSSQLPICIMLHHVCPVVATDWLCCCLSVCLSVCSCCCVSVSARRLRDCTTIMRLFAFMTCLLSVLSRGLYACLAVCASVYVSACLCLSVCLCVCLSEKERFLLNV